jgi:hypothetical protein
VGEGGNPWVEERNKKIPLNKLRGHSQLPLLWACYKMIKPFFIYVHEKLGAVGVLTQLLGSWNCTMAYISKQFPQTGHPACASW